MHAGKTILVVEDDYLIAMDLQDMLEGLGWQVIGPAATVRAALQLLEQVLPAMALLDVNLGREMVMPVAELLKARNVPFILATAYSDPERIGGKVLAGAINVGKPVAEHRLRIALARVMKA